MKNRVRIIRNQLNLSQREFGEKLGVSRDVISNIEYGRVQPKELLLKHMCQLFNVNPVWLHTGNGKIFLDEPIYNENLKEAINIFSQLRPEFQAYALEQIRNLVELQEKYPPDTMIANK